MSRKSFFYASCKIFFFNFKSFYVPSRVLCKLELRVSCQSFCKSNITLRLNHITFLLFFARQRMTALVIHYIIMSLNIHYSLLTLIKIKFI